MQYLPDIKGCLKPKAGETRRFVIAMVIGCCPPATTIDGDGRCLAR